MSNACQVPPGGIPEISPSDLKAQTTNYRIIDVRRPDEFTGELGHIKGATLVTIETDLATYLPKLPKDQVYAFVCRSGARSGRATEMALSLGFQKVFNMKGGMLAWNAEGFEVER